jgi:hypothetical protein
MQDKKEDADGDSDKLGRGYSEHTEKKRNGWKMKRYPKKIWQAT